MVKTLDEIGLEFGTDKASSVHDYCRFYDEIFHPLRYSKIKLIEFGVKFGSSIRMWEEYFPNADIFGVDMHLRWMGMSPSKAVLISSTISNRGSVSAIAEQHGPFDIAIDDSEHTVGVAKAVFEGLWPRWIKPGGWLIIEDVHVGYALRASKKQSKDLLEWACDMVKTLNCMGQIMQVGPKFRHGRPDAEIEMDRIVYVPGIMAIRRRP